MISFLLEALWGYTVVILLLCDEVPLGRPGARPFLLGVLSPSRNSIHFFLKSPLTRGSRTLPPGAGAVSLAVSSRTSTPAPVTKRYGCKPNYLFRA